MNMLLKKFFLIHPLSCMVVDQKRKAFEILPITDFDQLNAFFCEKEKKFMNTEFIISIQSLINDPHVLLYRIVLGKIVSLYFYPE